jgi:hypothetical protein
LYKLINFLGLFMRFSAFYFRPKSNFDQMMILELKFNSNA